MGWGTDFTAEIYLSRKIFSNQYELDEAIKSFEDEISNIKSRLLMYASANIKEITPTDMEEEPINFVYYKVTDEMKSLEENIIELHLLNLYKESNPDFTKKQI